MEKNRIFYKLFITNFGEECECICECGNTVKVKNDLLLDGLVKSCGCLKQKVNKNRKYSPLKASAHRVWLRRYNDSNLSFEDFYLLSQNNCYYCGSKPNNKYNSALDDKKSSEYAKDNGEFIYNGLDRIDNMKPHTADNVVTCCKWCNYAKRERTVDEFKEWINNLYERVVSGKDKRNG